jgi:hypothetical protein
MIKSDVSRQRLVLKVAAPLLISVVALCSMLLLFQFDTAFFLLDHRNAPEDSLRLVGIAAVIVFSVTSVLMTHRLMTDVALRTHGVPLLKAVSLTALGALGTAFTVLDMTFGIGESTQAMAIALTLGLVAALPLFVHEATRVRSLLAGIAVYCVFSGWIVAQREIDWNMRRPFLRAYSRIHRGMTKEQVEDIMRQQFPGKRPVGRFSRGEMQYTLDPDDSRFNAESICIQLIDGKVTFTAYLPD